MPRMIDLIRASALPANLTMAASKGSLAVPPGEMIEILVYLANHNKVFGQQAKLTLAGWEENASRSAASNPTTSKEVLDYMISPRNLRPILLPALLQNPSVSEEALAELAAAASRDVAEIMLNSERVKRLPKVIDALRANPHVQRSEVSGEPPTKEAETRAVEAEADDPPTPALALGAPLPQAASLASAQAAVCSDEILAEAKVAAPGPDNVLDEGLLAYLSQHAKEISDEGDKPFQPIGGFHEEFVSAVEEPLSEVAATGTAAAPKRAPVKKTQLSPTEERGSALQKISRLDIKGRIQLAMKGNKEERSLLIRDGTKIVALAVLESPKVSDGEIEKIASQKNVLEAVLRGIPLKRRFAKNYAIVRNLVFNPRTPLDLSLTLVKNLLVSDLRHLSGNKEVSDTVRKLALKMFKQKLDVKKG
jgi:hypothetical protein